MIGLQENSGECPNILVVDNDPVSQRLFSAIFRGSEFNLEFCDTAAEVPAALTRRHVDLLITEIVLPDDNGFELRKRIRLTWRELSIIFVSSVLDSAGRKLLENLSNDSFTFFMRKPILKAPMLALARQLINDLREREMHRNYFEQLQSDLNLASRMQQLMLPDWVSLESNSLFMIANYVPHSHLSGDYFDLLHMNDGRYFFVIGDISGHGVRSALQMSVVQSLTRAFIKNSNSPDVICDYLNELNRQICVEFDSMFYLTCLVAVIDPVKRTMEYLSAGHPGFFIYHQTSGEFEYLHLLEGDRNIPVGWLAEHHYDCDYVCCCEFPADGLMVALTDGVIERSDGTGTMLGIDGLGKVELPPHLDGLMPFILLDLLDRSNFSRIEDDMLILALGFSEQIAPGARESLVRAIPQNMRLAAQLSAAAGALTERVYGDSRLAYYAELVTGEFLNNIIVHAFDNAQRLTPKIFYRLTLYDDRIVAAFIDRGKPWDYIAGTSGFGEESVDALYDLAQAGRGMRIIEEIVDRIERHRIGSLNVTHFVLSVDLAAEE